MGTKEMTKEINLKKLTLKQLEQIALEKHGHRCYLMVQMSGGQYRKESWVKVIQKDRDIVLEMECSVWIQGLSTKFPLPPQLQD